MTAIDRLDAIRERAARATEGPWIMVTQGGIESIHYRGPGEVHNSVAQTRNDEDWEFVTYARQDVPAMEAALRKVLLIEPRPTLVHPNGITQQERERALGYNRALADVKAIIQDFLA